MMDIQTGTSLIIDLVQEIFDGEGIEEEVSISMPLIGGESSLDSMNLVELCLALEDKALQDGVVFDWTSEATLSQSRSMFRSVKSLAEEYVKQYEAQK